jgi:phosphatidylinositol alpha-1,6-mannosyltransferase
MKSFIFVTFEYPPQTGGIATYLANVVACFPKGSVRVLADEFAGSRSADMRSDVPIVRRRLLWRRLRPRWIPALYWTDRLCREERASMLIVSHLLPMGLIARILKRHRGLPYVVIVHGMDVALALEDGGRKRAQAKSALKDARLVVANSAYTAGLVESFGIKKEKIMIVRPSPGFPTDVTVPPDRAAAVRKSYAFEDGFTLLSVGRLVSRKGFADVIEAVAILKRRGKMIRLVIAGDGPERGALHALAETRGVADRVNFLGKVPDADLPGLYAAADAFVMTPRNSGADVEGFGIVYLEANLMGRPVIGSRAGGVPDAVIDGKTGLLIEPGNADAIAGAIMELHDDPALRARLGAEGRRRVLEEFGWQRQAGGLVEELLKE